MKKDFPQIKVMGERAILVEFTPEISEKQLEDLLFYKKLIQKKYLKQKVEVINTYSSLLIYYHNHIDNIYSEVSGVEELLNGTNIVKKPNFQLFYIPVCYDHEFGPDLDYISVEKNLSLEEIIALHSTPVYTVYFIGFLPGFLYLGGLDEKLKISRKNTPCLRVEKGAVGIGENQTGIYPKSSPGGWQIIGNSPVEIFDKNNTPPCPISSGDKIKFYRVSLKEYEVIKARISMGTFELKKEKYEG